jgi:hypothetical protein
VPISNLSSGSGSSLNNPETNFETLRPSPLIILSFKAFFCSYKYIKLEIVNEF